MSIDTHCSVQKLCTGTILRCIVPTRYTLEYCLTLLLNTYVLNPIVLIIYNLDGSPDLPVVSKQQRCTYPQHLFHDIFIVRSRGCDDQYLSLLLLPHGKGYRCVIYRTRYLCVRCGSPCKTHVGHAPRLHRKLN